MAPCVRMKRKPCFMLVMIDSPVRAGLKLMFRLQQRNDHGDERQRVQAETPRRADVFQRQSAQHRADDAGQIELDGIERDGVGQIFLFDQAGDQRGIGRAAERLRGADDERRKQDVPDLNVLRWR